MNPADRYAFFDPRRPYTVTFGELPHWEQANATYFITLRTTDAVPTADAARWNGEREEWLRSHGLSTGGGSGSWRLRLAKSPFELQWEYHRTFAAKLEATLDECHGKCELRRKDLAQVVADAFLYFDSDHVAAARNGAANGAAVNATLGAANGRPPATPRYHLSDFIVMPNHAHALVGFLGGSQLLSQCRSWKTFTTKKINQLLGKSGVFWESENLDHLVRDADQFDRFRRYIATNREKAGIGADEGIYYQSASLSPK